MEAAKIIKLYLRQLRSDEEYSKLNQQVVQAIWDLTDESVLPRK